MLNVITHLVINFVLDFTKYHAIKMYLIDWHLPNILCINLTSSLMLQSYEGHF